MEGDEEQIERLQKQAAEFKAIFDTKNKFRESFVYHFGWAIWHNNREMDKYELCPCDSGDKLKFCCLDRTKKFRKFLKENKNTLFIQDI